VREQYLQMLAAMEKLDDDERDILAALLLTACGKPSPPAPTAGVVDKKLSVESGAYTNVTISELQRVLANKDLVFVNVHIPYEGNIRGTDVSIPFNKIEEHLAQLPTDKDAKILLYCRSGSMSSC
jgi:hypothetical protein